MNRYVLAGGILLLFWTTGGEAYAKCSVAPYLFYLGQETTTSGVTDNGRCTHGFRSEAGSSFDSVEIARQPRNGKMQIVQGYKVRYIAKKGFVGSDSYAFKRCGMSRMGERGCAIINVAITVAR